MEIHTDKHLPARPAMGPTTATPATATTSDIDALATAMAEQGLFGKLRIGASLLLFGEVTLPTNEKHDA